MVRVVLTYGPTRPRLRADLSLSELSAGRVVWYPLKRLWIDTFKIWHHSIVISTEPCTTVGQPLNICLLYLKKQEYISLPMFFPRIFVLVKMLEYIMIDNIFVVIGGHGRSFNKDLAFQRTLDVIPFSSISSYVCLRRISVISQEKGQ